MAHGKAKLGYDRANASGRRSTVGHDKRQEEKLDKLGRRLARGTFSDTKATVAEFFDY